MEAVESWLAAHAKPPDTVELGLGRVKTVRRRLGLSLTMPVITVTGTNGKGSVCALLEAILCAAGWRVGCYTSPHILRFGERIRCGGQQAADETILEVLKKVHAASQTTTLTYFELTTLAAAAIFAEQKCDIVILEIGLGGRLDAVNVFLPTVSVITNIAIDHSEFLGDTRDAIAYEKAGICRPRRPVIVGDAAPPPALLPAISRRRAQPKIINQDFFATKEGRCWHYQGVGRQLNSLPLPALAGAHQINNAACALAALECLPADYWPGNGAIRIGLHAVTMTGRAQVLPGQPATVLDVAHNAAAAAVLERFLFDMGYYPQTRVVLGMLVRKDIRAFVAALAVRVNAWYVATLSDEGGGEAEAVAQAVREVVDSPVHTFPSVATAVSQAYNDSTKDDRIVITGSFLTIADFMKPPPAEKL